MINSVSIAQILPALIFKWAYVVVKKYAPCLKCVTNDYKVVMLF